MSVLGGYYGFAEIRGARVHEEFLPPHFVLTGCLVRLERVEAQEETWWHFALQGANKTAH